jgi:hypothetical protein
VRESRACSVGRKTLTSPDEGFMVPAIATSSSGQKSLSPANPKPVTIASAEADSRTLRGLRR